MEIIKFIIRYPQDKAKKSGRLGMHAVSEFASDLTPQYLDACGCKSIPNSVAYGYTASGYGFVQDMPYAYIHEFTRTSMAGKIRRFKGGYSSFWQKLSESLPIEVHCNTEVLAVRRNSDGARVDVKDYNGEIKVMDFDKIIISGSFPFKNGRIYRSPIPNSTGMLCHFLVNCAFLSSFSFLTNWNFFEQNMKMKHWILVILKRSCSVKYRQSITTPLF